MKYSISVGEGCIASPGGSIYYKLARTGAPGRRPLIIFSHEIGCTHARGAKYARPLGEYGCHLLTFDFLGGGAHCRGGVPTTEMTVLTELRDLEAVLDAARAWDFADPERIYLMGASQGGFVSAACAARRAGELAGLILLYPGLTIRQVMRRRFGSLGNVPDTFELNDWITLGRPYVEAVWDYDIDADIRAYTGPALIIQGSEDPVVSGRDVRRAAGLYRDAELHVIPGAGHGFEGRDVSEAVGYIESFIDRTGRENRAAV